MRLIYLLYGIILINMFGIAGIIVGIILIVLGGIVSFFMVGIQDYQGTHWGGDEFSIGAIFIGFIMIVIGVVLVFW